MNCPNCTIIQGDALALLKTLPAEHVQCVVTSPPYWGLRDYGVAGQIGLEPTPAEYLARMVAVFEEVRRVLRADGTCWVNMGDCYAGSGRGGNPTHESSTLQGSLSTQEQSMVKRTRKATEIGGSARDAAVTNIARKALRAGFHAEQVDAGACGRNWVAPAAGFKQKDLMGMPWRLAFALQAAGWYLRSDIIWHKPNPMPESVTDRPTKSHEYLFLLSKSERYHYDAEAIAEPAVYSPDRPTSGWDTTNGTDHHQPIGRYKPRTSKKRGEFNGKTNALPGCEAFRVIEYTRNKRTVWTIPTQAFPEAHFATFPEALVEPCIKAGCPAGGLVLDPFSGAGTTGLVAIKLGRRYLGIELNPAYAAMAERRIRNEAGLLLEVPA